MSPLLGSTIEHQAISLIISNNICQNYASESCIIYIYRERERKRERERERERESIYKAYAVLTEFY